MEKIGKALAYWLRHKPEAIDIKLDEEGWTDLDILAWKSGFSVNDIKEAVRTCPKQRYTIFEDRKIRANQGHSVELKMTFDEVEPPYFLYHGTVDKYLDSIFKEGLKPMQRHHVHLSDDVVTAKEVGNRRGLPKVLIIEANQMHEDGIKFYLSANGVYLVDNVEMKYIVGLV